MKPIKKPDLPFLITGLLMILIGWLISSFVFDDDTLDILLGNTYFVISFFHVFLLIGLYTLLQSLIYVFIRAVKRRPRPRLVIIHLSLLITPYITFILVLHEVNNEVQRYYKGDEVIITKELLMAVLLSLAPLMGLINVFLSKQISSSTL